LIEWRDIEDTIYDWFSEQTDVEAIWANHKAVQPEYPYGLLQVISGPSREGSFDSEVVTQTTTTSTIEHVGVRLFTVSCQILDCPNPRDVINTSRARIEKAQSSLSLESVNDTLRAGCLAVVDIGDISNIDFTTEDRYVSRSNMDIIFRTTSVVSETASVIDQVNGTWTGVRSFTLQDA